MPLRLRLIALVGLVLLLSLACGSLLVVRHEVNSVRTELQATLDVGGKTILNGIDRLGHVDDPAGELHRLIATFNGNRHLRVQLLDAQDQPLAASQMLLPAQPVPRWFLHIMGGESQIVRLPISPTVDAARVIELQTDPTNEIGEVWAESRDAVLVLTGFAALSALLISTVVGRALRTLEQLSVTCQQVGTGDYRQRIPVRGPPELRRLADTFNQMTHRLAAMDAQNQRLNERMLTLQAEERADLARDLHDEIGPMLFAVDMTATTIERLASLNRGQEIPTHAHAIHDAVAHMQRHVRAILGRLRPLQADGLQASIERLTMFWHGRRPDIAFSVDVAVDDDAIGSDLQETIYRVVQEGISNAIRHGRPNQIGITVTEDRTNRLLVAVTDDGVGMQGDDVTGRDAAPLGLIGMRERVMAMAGSLSIQPGPDGTGLSLVVHLPRGALQQVEAA